MLKIMADRTENISNKSNCTAAGAASENHHGIVTKLRVRDAFIILLGATILTLDVKYIFDPSGLVTGGVSGLSIVIKYISDQSFAFEIPLWVTNVVVNIPIFLYAMAVDGKRSLLRTFLCFVFNSAELYIFPDANIFPTDNLFLVSLFGGVLFGLSSGLLLTVRATSGGTDLLGKALHRTFRSFSMGTIIQILDGIIVVVGLLTFGMEKTLYAIFSVFVMGAVTDYVIDKGKKAKMCLIFSKATDDISSAILEELNRGCTGLKGTGMYSKEDKTVLMCVCSKNDLPDVKDIVKEYDKKAFFIVANISEAMGEGFVEHWSGNSL